VLAQQELEEQQHVLHSMGAHILIWCSSFTKEERWLAQTEQYQNSLTLYISLPPRTGE
jgi:hypothetical protein